MRTKCGWCRGKKRRRFFPCCCCHLHAFRLLTNVDVIVLIFSLSLSRFYFRQNCTTPGQKPPFSSACVFHCIENLYDKEYCNVCTKNTNPIKLNETEMLESILSYIHVRYDEEKDSIISLPSCSGEKKNSKLKYIGWK